MSVLEAYFENRNISYSMVETTYTMTWPKGTNIGLFPMGWHAFPVENDKHFFFLVELKYGPSVTNNQIEKAWKAVSKELKFNSEMSYGCGGFTGCGLKEKTPFLLCLAPSQKAKPDWSAEKRLDHAVLDVSMAIMQMAKRLGPIPVKHYPIHKWRLFINQVFFSVTSIENGVCNLVYTGKPAKKATEVKTEAKTETKPEAKVATKVGARMDPKPEPKVEDKDVWIHSSLTMKDIVGHDEVKTAVSKILWVASHGSEASRYQIPMPSGILMWGAPGCGKTMMAKAIAGELGWPCRFVTPGSDGSAYLYQTAQNIHTIFEQAKTKNGAVVVIDEFDSFAMKKDGHEKHMEEINQLLQELALAPESKIIVVACCNSIKGLEKAMIRRGRFDNVFHISEPDTRERKALMAKLLKHRPQQSDLDLDRLADLSAGLVHADLNFVVNDSAIQAAMCGELISQALLEQSIKACRACSAAEQRKIGF